MLLIASEEFQAVSEELNDEAMAFFALPNSKAAYINLNSPLESEKVRVRWSNMSRPLGLASSVLTTESYLRIDVLNKATVLDVSTRFEISDEYISKLTETTIIFPESCEDMS